VNAMKMIKEFKEFAMRGNVKELIGLKGKKKPSRQNPLQKNALTVYQMFLLKLPDAIFVHRSCRQVNV